MTIGERLEEARKRQGISIREAAEATKIRGDYLLAMEDNSMNIPLPEIYKRGFLKNYARLLKLDPAKILTDYEARELSRKAGTASGMAAGRPSGAHGHGNESKEESTTPPGSRRPTFGGLELPGHGDEGAATPEPDGVRREQPPRRPSLAIVDNTLYLKIAAGVAAFALLTVLIIVLVNLLRGSDEGVPAAPTTTGTERSTATPVRPAGTADGPTTLTFRAQDTVSLIVEQIDPPSRLFAGTLRAGESQTMEKTGPVSIRFTNGSGLSVERGDGQTFRPPAGATTGRMVVD